MNIRQYMIRKTIFGDGSPGICVPLTAGGENELADQLRQLSILPTETCQMVEYRADLFSAADPVSILPQIREAIGEDCPLLFTWRTIGEGGSGSTDPALYQRLLLEAAQSGMVDLVDVELLTAGEGAAELTKKLQEIGVKVIGSSHDFHRTPETDEMISRLLRMQEAGMDITKLAVMPQTRMDVLRLLECGLRMREGLADRPYVVISMGEMGLPSRCLCSFSGSAFTFASVGKASAPGQISAQKMRRILDDYGVSAPTV